MSNAWFPEVIVYIHTRPQNIQACPVPFIEEWLLFGFFTIKSAGVLQRWLYLWQLLPSHFRSLGFRSSFGVFNLLPLGIEESIETFKIHRDLLFIGAVVWHNILSKNWGQFHGACFVLWRALISTETCLLESSNQLNFPEVKHLKDDQ